MRTSKPVDKAWPRFNATPEAWRVAGTTQLPCDYSELLVLRPA